MSIRTEYLRPLLDAALDKHNARTSDYSIIAEDFGDTIHCVVRFVEKPFGAIYIVLTPGGDIIDWANYNRTDWA